jgi:methionyl-tRNA formyltransferase
VRIGFFGDGPWAVLALERLIELPGLDVAVVVGRSPDPDQELKTLAETHGVTFQSPHNVNNGDYLRTLAELNCDFHVSMSYDQIFRAEFLRTARDGAINCHAGLLPFYRGRNPLNWALINNESEFGITVHEIAIGIDTGDIILQRRLPIDPSSNYASLLKDAQTACADVLVEAVRLKMNGQVKLIEQSSIHPVGFYVGRRLAGDEIIDWSLSAERIHNFVRALVPPGPAARTNIGDSHFAVLRTALISGAPAYIATEGEVVGRADQYVVVKAADMVLAVSQVAPIDKHGRLGEPLTPRWPIGTRLGRNVHVELEDLHERVSRLEGRYRHPPMTHDAVVLGADGRARKTAKYIMIGTGEHARVVADAMRACGLALSAVASPNVGMLAGPLSGLPHITSDEEVLAMGADGILLVNGIGSIARPTTRRAAYEKFRSAGFRFASVVHPSAVIASHVEIESGAQVMAGAVVQTGAHVSADAIINTSAAVDHDCRIGEHVHIAPGACLSGNVSVGNSSHVGTGASVVQGKTIGAGVVVAAGAVVISDIPDGATVAGVPARSIRRSE